MDFDKTMSFNLEKEKNMDDIRKILSGSTGQRLLFF